MTRITGNLNGLKPVQLHLLENLSHRRIKPSQIINPELARTLTETTADIGRQIGILIDRAGHIQETIVGDSYKINLPDLKRMRMANQRFCGLRLIHTHLRHNEFLSEDDLTDLALLRLDLVAVLTFTEDGLPYRMQMAHLLPLNPEAKLWHIFEPEHPSQINDNFLELIYSIEAEFSNQARSRPAILNRNRAMIVGVYGKNDAKVQNRVNELISLSKTANINVIDTMLQFRDQKDPRFAIGKGKLQQVILKSMQNDIEFLVFDQELSPNQVRSIAALTDLKILDRTQLILDIFAQHANSRDGKLQVELAQLKYLKTRLSEKDDNMSRLTGGIGSRGPGETKLEIGRRRVQDRIGRLEKQLKKLGEQRALRRDKRRNQGIPNVSIIGYTNSGKSTLLNKLTNSQVLTRNALFATLDPTTRRLRFPDESEIIISDTVGFIQELPPLLLEAFRATLEELQDSHLLLHVLDIYSENIVQQQQSVIELLQQLKLNQIPQFLVFNQIDKADALALSQRIEYLHNKSIIDPSIPYFFLSAKTGENLAILSQAINKFF